MINQQVRINFYLAHALLHLADTNYASGPNWPIVTKLICSSLFLPPPSSTIFPNRFSNCFHYPRVMRLGPHTLILSRQDTFPTKKAPNGMQSCKTQWGKSSITLLFVMLRHITSRYVTLHHVTSPLKNINAT